AVGKGPVGTIKVNAKRDAGHFILEIEDDGQGIDPRVVRDTAVERGLINRKKAESMSDEEAMMLICIPGFSTKRQVSEVSGRGVGMSAVKSKIEALGGTITISSQVGTGTRVAMRLPASMATMKILVVEVKDHAYAIPISDVLAIEEVSSKDLRYVQGEPFIVIRNQVMRAYRLAALLGIEDEEKGSYMAIIVKRADGATYGLLVTRVIDEDEVAMKPVPRIIRGVRGLLGSSILGDGKPTFILDVMTLV
ncbi:MAG TPA: chemotaxis protein CheW, partial [Candidatus Methanomethylicus sp.]|nr:chemotaxis protein CheW [Candidatus Methanomethylicus sp.]